MAGKEKEKSGAGLVGLVLLCLSVGCVLCSLWALPRPAADRYEAVSGIGRDLPETDTAFLSAMNEYTLEELMTFPGIGEVTAGNILAEREANGGFDYPEDLLTVRGIGEAKLAGLLEAFGNEGLPEEDKRP